MAFFETMLVASGVAANKSIASTMAKKAANSFWDKVLAPLLKSRKAHNSIVNGSKKYISRLDKATKTISTVAIPGGSIALSDVYVPLTLVDQANKVSLKLDKYPESFFEANKRILITDTAGMGKSTALKFIVQAVLLQLKAIPILVELRKIASGETLYGYICKEFSGCDQEVCGTVLEEVLSAGNVLLLLDGYDEIEDGLRKRINGEISELSAKFEKCNFIVSSRPDSELKGLSDFKEYRIRPLEMQEAFTLIKKYGHDGDVAERLISKVKSNNQIHEFLRNPLLVSLLFKAFEYKGTIPFKRHIFFRQVYDALYQDHDLSKGAGFERKKKTGLDIEDFHKAVRALGIVTFFIGRVQYSNEEFHASIESAKRIVDPLNFEAGKLRVDLLSAVPIFQKDGVDIRWAHKAFQDYFSAQYIFFDSGSTRDELIKKLVDPANPRKNENILVMLADLDRRLVRSLVSKPFLSDCLVEFDKSRFRDRESGFQMFLAEKFGDIFFIRKAYVDSTLKDDFSGFGKFMDDVKKFGLRSNFQSASHVSLNGGKLTVCNTPFLDKFRLISALEPDRSLGSGLPVSMLGAIDRFSHILDEPICSFFDLLEDSTSPDKTKDLLSLLERSHGVRTMSLDEAREIVDSVNEPLNHDLDWLMSVIPKKAN
ncbi:NACHT domain-containing protein [Rhodanobacter glycinis]|uniref:NACHT domain-containing protein n=1 Tax=Rhodanobacter glycinis TaxID=582702 RepID=A0A1I4C2A3_9GAMM|nr:NACHT domain-containing protein [Rhodanobacter glycinis]SFK75192.1 NACHT domain-containing protein [Rhodanobacter glycinis]